VVQALLFVAWYCICIFMVDKKRRLDMFFIIICLMMQFGFMFIFPICVNKRGDNGYKLTLWFKISGPVFMALMSVFKDGTEYDLMY